MATKFNVFDLRFLGQRMDTNKTDDFADKANLLENKTFGSENDPLYNKIQTWGPVAGNPPLDDRYDWFYANGRTPDQFNINQNGQDYPFTMDAFVVIRAKLTYIDGTESDEILVRVAQAPNTQMWLVPAPAGAIADQAALTAKPIVSVTFGDVVANNNNMFADRPDDAFIQVIDGTDGDDVMDRGFVDRDTYTENAARIDDSGNYISGGDGGDTIRAGDGDDVIYGGDGDDAIYGGRGDDKIYGGDGNDLLVGNDGNDMIYGGAGDDTIYGNDGNNQLFGGDGDDKIYGSTGNDILDGGAGNDYLNGWNGTNTLTGGGGFDEFRYNNPGSDITITDFNMDAEDNVGDGNNDNNDRIDLSNFYDRIKDLRDDYADDGRLNQSNSTASGGTADYSGKTSFAGGSIKFANIDKDDDLLNKFNFETTGVTCFAAGTMIRIPQGDVPVETLKIGDMVSTWNGVAKPVRWIGKTELSRDQLDANPKLKPVVINRSVLGSDRDLTVSPQHAFVINGDAGVLVRAVHMVKNGWKGVRVAQNKRAVTYLHIMLEQHDIIIAEGVPSESMYPGPMMIGSLDDAQREELFAIFPELQHIGEKDDVAALYGPSVLPYAKRSTAAADMLQLQKAG